MSDTILVTGATGNVGGEVAKQLKDNNINVRIAARELTKAKSAGWSNNEIIEFDYDKPETFDKALQDVTRVFLVAPPLSPISDKLMAPFVDKAKATGVKHIVFLTAMGIEVDDNIPLRKTELQIEKSGINYTFLRPNWFMQNFATFQIEPIKEKRALYIPAADAKTSFIDVRDIAEVAVKAFDDRSHYGKAYTLTGNEALDHGDVAKSISEVIGQEVKYMPITDEDARKQMKARGWPDQYIDVMLFLYEDVRQGNSAPVFPDTETILGRKPITFKRFAEDNADSWK